MAQDTDWIAIRRAAERGETDRALARRFGVSANAITLRANKEDWGGRATRIRRDKVVKMLMRAGEKLVSAHGAEDVNVQARRLTALGGMAKAMRAFDPRLAAQATAPDAAEAFAVAVEEQAAFDAEIEEVIEARVAERLARRAQQ